MLASIVFTSMLIGKPNTAAIIAQSWKETRVVGHRGAAAYKPENTLESFEEAIRCQADATECDVHVSQDGEVVVMHDSTLDRTTTLKGAVKSTPWSAMKAAGIPSLADLTKVTRDRIVLVVEIKAGEGVSDKVVKHLQSEKLLDQSIVFSFGAEHVERCEDLEPNLFSVWLVGKKLEQADYPGVFAELERIGADGVGLQYRQVTPEFVTMAHEKRVPVFVWTVPPGPEVDRLKSLKVNFIITDHPRDVRNQLRIG